MQVVLTKNVFKNKFVENRKIPKNTKKIAKLSNTKNKSKKSDDEVVKSWKIAQFTTNKKLWKRSQF